MGARGLWWIRYWQLGFARQLALRNRSESDRLSGDLCFKSIKRSQNNIELRNLRALLLFLSLSGLCVPTVPMKRSREAMNLLSICILIVHVSRSLQTWHSLNINERLRAFGTNGNCMRNSPRKRREIKNARKELLPHSTMQSPASMCWFQTRVLDFHFLLRRAARLIVLRNRLLELFYLIGSGHLKTCAKLLLPLDQLRLDSPSLRFFLLPRKFKRSASRYHGRQNMRDRFFR